MITSGLNLSGGMVAQELNAGVAVAEEPVVVRRTRVGTGAVIGGGTSGGGAVGYLGLSSAWCDYSDRTSFYEKMSEQRIDTVEERLKRSIAQLDEIGFVESVDRQDPIWRLFVRTLEKATQAADEARLKQASRRFEDVLRFTDLVSELQSAVKELQRLKEELSRRQVGVRVVEREVIRERPIVQRVYQPVYLPAATFQAHTSGWLTRVGAALPVMLLLAGVGIALYFYFRMKTRELEASTGTKENQG